MDFDRLRRRRASSETAVLDVPGCTEAVEVGRGGFGVVYRAQQPAYRRTVAVKVLRASLDGKTRERFERECMALGSLSGHPNIVTLFDAGLTRAGDPYLVMEYLGGGSLEERMDPRSPMGWQEAVDHGIRLAGALQTAHQAGVLHRDIKPRNVLTSSFGDLRLVDFGLARLKGSLETRQADVAASVAYAAPEILSGQPPSVASDVYSLGATVFSLLWGSPPFVTDDEQLDIQVISRIASMPVPDARPLGVPDSVCQVLERTMAKDPAQRFASAGELGGRLQAAQAEAGLPVTPLPLEQEAPARPAAEPPPGGSFFGGQGGEPAAAPPSRPDAGQTVRRARAPVADGSPGWQPPGAGRPAYSSPAAAVPAAGRFEKLRESLADRTGIPDTIGGRPTGLVVGGALGLLALLLVAGWLAIGAGGGSPTAEATPPVEGRYRYMATVSGERPPVDFPESLVEVRTTSRSGDSVNQTIRTAAGDGSSDETAFVWKPDGLYEDETVRTKSGVQEICDWQPDIRLLRFPLATGPQPVVDVTCRRPPSLEVSRRITTRVVGSARMKIAGKDVRVWNVERTETRRILAGSGPATVEEVTRREKFAPRYGLTVEAVTDVKSTSAGRTSTSSIEVRLLNLDPV